MDLFFIDLLFFSSPYKINPISSVCKGILCQDNPNYSVGCLVNVNMLN